MTRTVAVMLAFLLALPAAASNKFKDLPPDRQQKYHGTQPGYHRLSDAFAVDVRERLMTFYYLGASGDGEPVAMGTIVAIWGDHSNFGPREIAFAISADGKRLLFFDEPGVAQGKPLANKLGMGVADLYRMDAGKGEKELVHREVHRRAFSCIVFPANMIAFSQVQPKLRLDEFALSTEGEELSLAERQRKLIEAGRVGQICGPL